MKTFSDTYRALVLQCFRRAAACNQLFLAAGVGQHKPCLRRTLGMSLLTFLSISSEGRPLKLELSKSLASKLPSALISVSYFLETQLTTTLGGRQAGAIDAGDVRINNHI